MTPTTTFRRSIADRIGEATPLAHLALITGHVLTWLKLLNDSFWLDECGTVWLIQGGMGDILRRTLILLHTPLFAFIAAFTAAAGGLSEFSLRFPSWIAAITAVFFFYKLATELLDSNSAWAATAIFALWPNLLTAAADARPYAFVLAALCACYFYFIRAVRSNSTRDILACGLFATLAIHFHLLFAYAVPPLGLFLILFGRDSIRARPWMWSAAAACVFTLSLPLIRHFEVLLFLGGRYSFAASPTISRLQQVIAPTRPLIFYFFAMALASFAITHITRPLAFKGRRLLAFALTTSIVPVGAFFLLSHFTDTKLFVPRYLSAAVPGLALLWGWLLGWIQPAGARTLISLFALTIALASQWYAGNWHHETDDWKGVMERAGQLTPTRTEPLVIYTSFVESASIEALRDPDRRSSILSPLAAYPSPSPTVVALPLLTGQDAQDYWQEQFTRSINRHRAFTVIIRAEIKAQWWYDYLIRFSATHGYRVRHREFFGRSAQIVLLHFART